MVVRAMTAPTDVGLSDFVHYCYLFLASTALGPGEDKLNSPKLAPSQV